MWKIKLRAVGDKWQVIAVQGQTTYAHYYISDNRQFVNSLGVKMMARIAKNPSWHPEFAYWKLDTANLF